VIEVRPTSEDSPFLPLSIYGLTKQVQEQAVLILGNTLGINAFALRYQNVYGPGQSLKNPYTGILAVFSNLARQNQEIELYEDGLESRDFVYIDDVIDATIKAINYKNKFVGALNIGSGMPTSVKVIAEEINLFFKNDRSINVTGGFRMGDIRHNIADLSLVNRVLGFQPKVPFRKGLSNFLNWAANQKETDHESYLRSVSELNARGLMGHQRINYDH
jgi:dTDP-L-rhamnose 4-epimerase